MPHVSVHGAGHTPRPHAHPHRASHSYPRYHGATCRTYRCMTQATRLDRMHTSSRSYPRYAGATRRTYRCMAQATRLDRTIAARQAMRTPGSHTLRSHHRRRLGLLCAARTAVALPAVQEALVALRICRTRRVRKSSGPRRAAAERDTANRGLGAVRAVVESRPQVHIYMATPARRRAVRCRRCGADFPACLSCAGRSWAEGRLHRPCRTVAGLRPHTASPLPSPPRSRIPQSVAITIW